MAALAVKRRPVKPISLVCLPHLPQARGLTGTPSPEGALRECGRPGAGAARPARLALLL